MFITGPDVIKLVTHEEVTKDQLGGAMTHNETSGVAHFLSHDDAECLSMVRELLSFIPSNNLEDAPRKACSDPTDRADEKLDSIVPDQSNQPYDIKDVIHSVVDDGYFFEVQEHYARNIVIGFARLNGRSIGIVANQPAVLAGTLDINASIKGARFVRFCDCFNIPLVTFEDVPGFLPEQIRSTAASLNMARSCSTRSPRRRSRRSRSSRGKLMAALTASWPQSISAQM